MPEITLLEKLIIYIPPVLFAIIFHEIAHGWVASRLGDQTARSMGRLSLNPVKHIDPVGTVLIPALMYYFTPYIFGWAKPVPIDWRKLGHPRRDMALVAIAGPAANLIMLICWAIVAKFLVVVFHEHGHISFLLIAMCSIGVIANVILMVLNLFPLLPLDGGRIFTAVLPGKLAVMFSRLEPFGLLILVGLLVSGVLFGILGPMMGGTIMLVDNFLEGYMYIPWLK